MTATPATPATPEGQGDETVFAWAWSLFDNGGLNERRLTFTKDDPFEIAVNGGDGRFVSVAVPLYTRAQSAHADIEAGDASLAAYKAENAKHGWSGRGYGFDPFSMALNKDGGATIGFNEDDANWEQDDESSRQYIYCNVAASEILALRDYLNEAFPVEAGAPAGDAVAVQWQRAMMERQRNRDLPDFSLPASAFPDLRTGGGGTLSDSGQKCIRQDCDCFDTWHCSRPALAHPAHIVDGLVERLTLLIQQYGPSSPVEAWMREVAGLVERLTAELTELRDELTDSRNAEYAMAHALAASDAAVLALTKALKPFAEMAQIYDPQEGDDDLPCWDTHNLTIGHLRDARAALSQAQPTAPGANP